MDKKDLHVIAVFNNNRRWVNRLKLLKKFVEHMVSSGVTLHLCEHVMGQRDFAYSEDDPMLKHFNYYKIRGDEHHEGWLKEGLQQYVSARLPDTAKYLAIIDADVTFTNPDWVHLTLDMLQCHRVGQPWSFSVDMDQNNNPVHDEHGNLMDRSFSAAWIAGDVRCVAEDYGLGQPSGTWLLNEEVVDWRQHYGYAWAFRMDVWNAIGGLPEWLITGEADYISAMAFSGRLNESRNYTSPGAQRRIRRYAELCDKHVRQDIGVVPGILHHGFHGSKKKRFYMTRGEILRESNFDPDIDIGRDRHGLPYLCSDNRILRDGIRRLSVMRDEDSSLGL